jgi:hypothetical protein
MRSLVWLPMQTLVAYSSISRYQTSRPSPSLAMTRVVNSFPGSHASAYLEGMVRNLQPFLLTTFSIKNIILDYRHLVECLKLLPFLDTLTIMEFIESPENTTKPHNKPTPSIFPGVARALIWRVRSPLVVPKLRALTLVGQPSGGDTKLMKMLGSRLRSHPKKGLPEVAKLNYIHLVFRYHSLTASARKRLREMKGKDGLEIRIVENSCKMSI